MTKFLISLTGDKKQTKKAGAGGGGGLYQKLYKVTEKQMGAPHRK